MRSLVTKLHIPKRTGRCAGSQLARAWPPDAHCVGEHVALGRPAGRPRPAALARPASRARGRAARPDQAAGRRGQRDLHRCTAARGCDQPSGGQGRAVARGGRRRTASRSPRHAVTTSGRPQACCERARPTAVNLALGVRRALAAYEQASRCGDATASAAGGAGRSDGRSRRRIAAASMAMAGHGLALVPAGARILTHCNTGCLVSAGDGTAFALILAAHRAGRLARLWVDETRPLLQGARLTAYEARRGRDPARGARRQRRRVADGCRAGGPGAHRR